MWFRARARTSAASPPEKSTPTIFLRRAVAPSRFPTLDHICNTNASPDEKTPCSMKIPFAIVPAA